MIVNVLKVEDAENCRKKLELEIPVEEIQTKVNELFDELQKSAAIPGFRAGHVPRKMLETRFTKRVRSQAIEDLLPTAYEQAVKDQKFEPIGSPYVTDIKSDPDQPVQFKVEFEVRPEVKLGEYVNIPVKKQTISVTNEEVDKIIQNLREQQANYLPITDRPSKEGDFVYIDFTGKIDGKKFEGGTAKGVRIELGKSQIFPEFEKALVDKTSGAEMDVTVSFPVDHPDKKIAGKQAIFHITLKEIKEKQLPNIDDEFAKDMGEYETLDKLKEKIKADSLMHKEEDERENMKTQIIDTLVSQTNLDVPGSMVDHYSREIFLRNEFRLREYGLTHEQVGTTKEQAAQQSVDTAKKQIKTSFILDAIAEKENVTVSDEEIEKAIANIANQNKIDPVKYREALVGQKKLDSLRYQLREEKVLSYILEKASIEQV